MVLPRAYTPNQEGFTFVEVIIVIGIAALIFAFVSFFSTDTYRGYIFRSERNLAVSALQKARNQSVSNIDQAKHGVHYDNGSNCTGFTTTPCYIIFEGDTFSGGASTNEIISANAAVSVSWSDVVFNQLDGSVTSPPGSAMHLSDTANHSSDISINNEGRISWTN